MQVDLRSIFNKLNANRHFEVHWSVVTEMFSQEAVFGGSRYTFLYQST